MCEAFQSVKRAEALTFGERSFFYRAERGLSPALLDDEDPTPTHGFEEPEMEDEDEVEVEVEDEVEDDALGGGRGGGWKKATSSWRMMA